MGYKEIEGSAGSGNSFNTAAEEDKGQAISSR
jgi:hypothetical protein